MFFLSGACESSNILKIIYFVMEIVRIATIIIPIGLIAMLAVDFVKNVIGKEDEMGKNLKIAIKRLIFCAVIFLIPSIVNISVTIFSDIGLDSSYTECLSNANLDVIRYYEADEKLAEEDSYVPDTPVDPEKSDRTIIAKDSEGPNNSNSNSSSSSDDDDDDDKEGSQRILSSARKFFKKVEKDGRWAHKNEKAKYPNASHYTACCLVVSTILKGSGHLSSGTVCHADSGQMPAGYKKLKNMEVIKTHDMSKLKPGDIMVKNGGGSNHNIAIFAYKKNGDYYVFGASDTSELRLRKHPAARSWWKRHGITAIIRAKD